MPTEPSCDTAQFDVHNRSKSLTSGGLSRRGDDSRFPTVAVEQLPLQPSSWQHPVEKIWPVERADKLEGPVRVSADVMSCRTRAVAVAV